MSLEDRECKEPLDQQDCRGQQDLQAQLGQQVQMEQPELQVRSAVLVHLGCKVQLAPLVQVD